MQGCEKMITCDQCDPSKFDGRHSYLCPNFKAQDLGEASTQISRLLYRLAVLEKEHQVTRRNLVEQVDARKKAEQLVEQYRNTMIRRFQLLESVAALLRKNDQICEHGDCWICQSLDKMDAELKGESDGR